MTERSISSLIERPDLLTHSHIDLIIAPLAEAGLDLEKIRSWHDEKALRENRRRFPDVDFNVRDFSIAAILNGIARRYRDSLLARLPATSASPRKALVVLKRLNKWAASAALAKRRRDRTNRAKNSDQAVTRVLEDPLGREYLREALQSCFLSAGTLQNALANDLIERLRQDGRWSDIATIAADAMEAVSQDYNYWDDDNDIGGVLPPPALPRGEQSLRAADLATRQLGDVYRALANAQGLRLEPTASTWNGVTQGTFLEFAEAFFLEVAAIDPRCVAPSADFLRKVRFKEH